MEKMPIVECKRAMDGFGIGCSRCMAGAVRTRVVSGPSPQRPPMALF
jgi:hypothetical protein